MIFAIAAIVVILVIFVLGATVIREVSKYNDDIVILKSNDTGLDDFERYMRDDFEDFLSVRSDVFRRGSVKIILGGANEK